MLSILVKDDGNPVDFAAALEVLDDLILGGDVVDIFDKNGSFVNLISLDYLLLLIALALGLGLGIVVVGTVLGMIVVVVILAPVILLVVLVVALLAGGFWRMVILVTHLYLISAYEY